MLEGSFCKNALAKVPTQPAVHAVVFLAHSVPPLRSPHRPTPLLPLPSPHAAAPSLPPPPPPRPTPPPCFPHATLLPPWSSAPHFPPPRSPAPCSSSSELKVGFLCPRHRLGRLFLRTTLWPLPVRLHQTSPAGFISSSGAVLTFPFFDFGDWHPILLSPSSTSASALSRSFQGLGFQICCSWRDCNTCSVKKYREERFAKVHGE